MKTNSVKIGDSIIGGGFPVAVQSMWKVPLSSDTEGIVEGIRELKKIGCDIMRFSVPDSKSAEYLIPIIQRSSIPVVADIHFDYKLALQCISYGVDKIRINPGNIGVEWKVRDVVRAAQDKNIPIRVGVNTGSLPKDLLKMKDKAQAMVLAAERELEIFERVGFKEVVFSLKASDINTTVEANSIFSEKYRYPLHLGVTEAGPLIPGIVKSAFAISRLLAMGIGDTIRVSLSDNPSTEVIAGREILKAAGLMKTGVRIISCPRCGRASFDTHSFVKELEPFLYGLKKNISVAIMGCIVNGPGEAREADLGITGSGDKIVIFRKGEIIHRINPESAVETFKRELELFE